MSQDRIGLRESISPVIQHGDLTEGQLHVQHNNAIVSRTYSHEVPALQSQTTRANQDITKMRTQRKKCTVIRWV